MKGQSSLEYLITYGWMLIAVAIASGIAFTNFQSSCQRTFNGFYTDAVSVEQFGVDESGALKISLKNHKYTTIEVNSLNISSEESNISKAFDKNITGGRALALDIDGFKISERCNELDMTLDYDRLPLESQKASGQMKAPLEITG